MVFQLSRVLRRMKELTIPIPMSSLDASENPYAPVHQLKVEIPAPRRLRQENCLEFNESLGYKESSSLIWAKIPVSKLTKQVITLTSLLKPA